jgi:hypothetical protein
MYHRKDPHWDLSSEVDLFKEVNTFVFTLLDVFKILKTIYLHLKLGVSFVRTCRKCKLNQNIKQINNISYELVLDK